ncbi:MAG TPA: hypothetical protein VI776_08275 [Anaerolineales bacterium]|nr:hypothetical protein [Anaerolineales bacterium]
MRQSESTGSGFDWALVFLWMMATTLGWVLGRTLLPNLAIIVTGPALTPDELDLLDETSAQEPGYPNRFLQLYAGQE